MLFRSDLIRYNIIDEKIEGMMTTYLTCLEGKVPSEFLTNNKTEKDYLTIPITSPINEGGTYLQTTWKDYKIWLPISEEQIGVNQALTQNAGWSAKADAPTDTPAAN